MPWSTVFIIAVAVLLLPTIDVDDPCRFKSSRGVIDLTSLGLKNESAAHIQLMGQ